MIGLALKETQPGKLWAQALQGSRQLKHTLRWNTVRGSLGSVRLILTLPKQRWGYKVGCFPFVNTLQWPCSGLQCSPFRETGAFDRSQEPNA